MLAAGIHDPDSPRASSSEAATACDARRTRPSRDRRYDITEKSPRGDRLLRSRRRRDAPEMPLPVILIERVDVVFRLDARAFVGGPRLDGEEVDEGAVRRPGRARHAGGVAGDHARLAAGRHAAICPSRDEEDLLPVGGPARRRLAVGPGQLDRGTAGDLLAPDVAGAPVRRRRPD